ncbi:DinB family protein [Brevibacillus choshinensis]|uniref:DinB family protein n=1 Tax=Brevibacillus choshinensis TaxID=54911 RepID=A0ABX7FQY4_BRECH|nr:DinB family protein [Brevibacillus choshinensis]QRG68658.1 DinB family protein [Brevibacillus choshinensis]
MNTKELLQRFEESTARYIEELSRFTMEELRRQPSPSEWSIGQMYVHLYQSALYMQLANIAKCQSGSDVTTGEKSEIGRDVFAKGELPPIRVQVPPSPEYTPAQPESKEQILEGLNAVVARVQEVEPQLQAISPEHKIAHPAFGLCNAQEWFQLIEMHYRHHFRQLDRLKGELVQN